MGMQSFLNPVRNQQSSDERSCRSCGCKSTGKMPVVLLKMLSVRSTKWIDRRGYQKLKCTYRVKVDKEKRKG